MSDSTRDVPEQVSRAAAETWKKWSGEIAAVAPRLSTADFAAHGAGANSEVWKTPEERMIDKIRRRMDEFPEWYETDQDRLASTVCAELERIGATLAHALPRTHGAVDVWQIPLSVFNWLVDGGNDVRFIRGALSAWSDGKDESAEGASG
ncbi:MAG: hypothetical protein IPL47_06730 [Phyllobacteriaceae bacterium]|nr:hypothetical protein [Phyllobacteriaceae bacterium]